MTGHKVVPGPTGGVTGKNSRYTSPFFAQAAIEPGSLDGIQFPDHADAVRASGHGSTLHLEIHARLGTLATPFLQRQRAYRNSDALAVTWH